MPRTYRYKLNPTYVDRVTHMGRHTAKRPKRIGLAKALIGLVVLVGSLGS